MGTKRRVCRGAKRQRNVAPVEPVESERETFVLVWCGVGWGGVGSFPGASILMGRDGDMDGDDDADAAARIVGGRSTAPRLT